MTLDTTLPRSYNRDFTVRGTKGLYEQATNSVYLDGEPEYWESTEYYTAVMNNAKTTYGKDYLPPEWTDITEETKQKGHGGMDYLLIRKFIRLSSIERYLGSDCFFFGASMSAAGLLSRILRF